MVGKTEGKDEELFRAERRPGLLDPQVRGQGRKVEREIRTQKAIVPAEQPAK